MSQPLHPTLSKKKLSDAIYEAIVEYAMEKVRQRKTLEERVADWKSLNLMERKVSKTLSFIMEHGSEEDYLSFESDLVANKNVAATIAKFADTIQKYEKYDYIGHAAEEVRNRIEEYEQGAHGINEIIKKLSFYDLRNDNVLKALSPFVDLRYDAKMKEEFVLTMVLNLSLTALDVYPRMTIVDDEDFNNRIKCLSTVAADAEERLRSNPPGDVQKTSSNKGVSFIEVKMNPKQKKKAAKAKKAKKQNKAKQQNNANKMENIPEDGSQNAGGSPQNDLEENIDLQETVEDEQQPVEVTVEVDLDAIEVRTPGFQAAQRELIEKMCVVHAENQKCSETQKIAQMMRDISKGNEFMNDGTPRTKFDIEASLEALAHQMTEAEQKTFWLPTFQQMVEASILSSAEEFTENVDSSVTETQGQRIQSSGELGQGSISNSRVVAVNYLESDIAQKMEQVTLHDAAGNNKQSSVAETQTIISIPVQANEHSKLVEEVVPLSTEIKQEKNNLVEVPDVSAFPAVDQLKLGVEAPQRGEIASQEVDLQNKEQNLVEVPDASAFPAVDQLKLEVEAPQRGEVASQTAELQNKEQNQSSEAETQDNISIPVQTDEQSDVVEEVVPKLAEVENKENDSIKVSDVSALSSDEHSEMPIEKPRCDDAASPAIEVENKNQDVVEAPVALDSQVGEESKSVAEKPQLYLELVELEAESEASANEKGMAKIVDEMFAALLNNDVETFSLKANKLTQFLYCHYIWNCKMSTELRASLATSFLTAKVREFEKLMEQNPTTLTEYKLAKYKERLDNADINYAGFICFLQKYHKSALYPAFERFLFL